jgi:uroporphyrinogen decarboxylase
MRRETMNARERWEAVITRQMPDRVPMDYWATTEASEKLMRHLGLGSADEILKHFHIDSPHGVGGRYIGPEPPEGQDIWGITYRDVKYATGTYSEIDVPPLARFNTIEEMNAGYTWPTPDMWDHSHLPEEAEYLADRPSIGGNVGPFYMYTNLRGLEQAFADLIENPEFVHACLDKIAHLQITEIQRIHETIPGKVLMSFFAEDMGSQEGLLLSPTQIREFIMDKVEPMIDLVHDAGAYVIHHNDGAIRGMLPELIDFGIDILNPVQWRCAGMEREGLKRDFGNQLIFHGGMDNQETLPFGSVSDVIQEVRDNLRILGEGGGYILAPCHNIQAVSPPENIVAMYETAYEEGWTS